MVIDPAMERPIGATAWASTGLEDYDDLSEVLRRREKEENGEEEHESLAKSFAGPARIASDLGRRAAAAVDR